MRTLFGPHPGTQVWLWVLGAGVVFIALLAFLHSLPGRQKRSLIVGATFLAGLFFALEFFIPVGTGAPRAEGNLLSRGIEPLADFTLVIGAMAIGLGVINLAHVQGRKLVRMQSGWQNALIFFVGIIGMTVAGIAHDAAPKNTAWTGANDYFFGGLYTPLSSSTFALLAFFIASAAFRAFRITSVESTLMMITAFIVMLGNVGSEIVTGWLPTAGPLSLLRLDNLTLWIMTTVNMSAQRALIFGIAMGELAIALRVWLSLERGAFFDQEV